MIVEIKDLVKRYHDVIALNHIDLEINEGEIFGLLGPNGSGKTTLIHCLLALLSYEKGKVKLFDKPMYREAYELKRQIGFVMQELAFYEELTVYENIKYFCSLYIQDKNKCQDLVEEAIAFVNLEDYVNAYPKTLSGGLKRRLNIACGIAHKPKFMIFDEPTIAIDPKQRRNILEGIKKLNKEGATILYTSHYMEEIEQLCSQIAIMNEGSIVARGSKEALLSMINMGETICLEAAGLTEGHLIEIKKLPYAEDVIYEAGYLKIKYKKGRSNLMTLLNYFEQIDISVGNINTITPDLNDVFIEMTGKPLER